MYQVMANSLKSIAILCESLHPLEKLDVMRLSLVNAVFIFALQRMHVPELWLRLTCLPEQQRKRRSKGGSRFWGVSGVFGFLLRVFACFGFLVLLLENRLLSSILEVYTMR